MIRNIARLVTSRSIALSTGAGFVAQKSSRALDLSSPSHQSRRTGRARITATKSVFPAVTPPQAVVTGLAGLVFSILSTSVYGQGVDCNGMVFSNVTEAAGITHHYVHPSTQPNGFVGGAVAEDFNNDGWVDLFAVQGAGGPCLLYMNDQSGGFVDEAAARGAALVVTGAGTSAADYDNDGDVDIAVSVLNAQSVVLVNDGTGHFTSSFLLPEPLGTTTSSSWGDVDNDGQLELMIGQWAPRDNPSGQGLFVYRNLGGGNLESYEFRTTPEENYSLFAPRFVDVNGDRLSDIHAGADHTRSELFLNVGGGMFDNVTTAGHVGTGNNDMGHAVGDYDNDGDLDLFTSDISRSSGNSGNRLYNNDGSGTFTEVQVAAGVKDGAWGWGASFGDLDNDGDLDLYHVNGWLSSMWVGTPARLFMNLGDGTFEDVAACAGADDTGQGRGMLLFDYDNDGDLDSFIVNNRDMEAAGDDFPGTPVLLRNDTANGNNWLKVNLNGAPPLHGHGIGSRVYVAADGQSMMRELDASTNFLSQNPGRIAHFGLGSAPVATEARAEWVNGDSTILYSVDANQEITINSPVATVSSRSPVGTESVTASAPSETNPKQWLIEGVLYEDPVTISFSSGGIKELSLLVYDTDEVTLIRKETLRVQVSGFPEITSPAPGSVLAGATTTFEWTPGGSAVTEWQLQIGSAPGGNDLFDSGSLADTTLSATVNGLPVDGSTVYTRLSYTVDSVVSSLDYEYTASSGSLIPEITSPTPGSVLPGDTVNFQWAGNGAPVYKWRLWVGTTPGANNLFSNFYGAATLSQTVSGLPTDGSTVYVRLTWKDNSGSSHNLDYQYTASGSLDMPGIVAPPPGSVLPGETVDFDWTAAGAAVTEWQLEIGSAPGGNDLFNSGSLPDTTLSATVNGLPVDGSAVHVRLSYTIAGVVSSTDYQYLASGGSFSPEMTSPTPGSVLPGGTVNFQWVSNGAPVAKWRLWGGTTVGGNNLFTVNFGAAGLSTIISGLPTDGSTIYVRLTWKDDVGILHDLDYDYTAAASAPVPPEILSPAPGSVLPGDTVTFQWIGNGAPVTSWRLWVGTIPGANDLYSTHGGPNLLSATATGLLTDGLPVYARLSWKGNLGVIHNLDYQYTAGGEALSAARIWNEELLHAIRKDFARPTVHARNLFHVSTAMWDAWAAYDATAMGVLHNESASAADVPSARSEAISYAAYRILKSRFVNSPGAPIVLPSFDHMMLRLGYDPDYTGTAGLSPADLGNRIAETVLAFGDADGSNEANGYGNQYYEPVNPPLLPALPGNPDIIDPNLWQPLALDFFIDQSGNLIVGGFPPFLSPEWGQVTPFALPPDDLTIYNRDGFDYWVYHDPGPPPFIGTATEEYYKWGFEMVSVWSSHLDPSDGVMIDISPGVYGNAPLADPEDWESFYDFENGGDKVGIGHPVNPVTGLPYEPNLVPRGDYTRVLAEFWADGPDSETPPGHWFTIANYVSDHPMTVKSFGGAGPELDPLEWDVKLYLILGGTMHDCAVTAWGVKGWYDYVRPVSAIRYMADMGQASDPLLPSYHPHGVNLRPGLIELVTVVSTIPGERHEHLAGHEGKIAILAWRGPDFIPDPETDVAGVGWILAENWWPYQRPTFVTPPFAGYVSGHSTFSRAGAVALTLITGSPFFPGGMGVFHCPQNEFLVFEDGPSVDITLQWATYNDASDQTSLSRIWGGIHPPADDLPGRHMGQAIGENAFNAALQFFAP